MKITNCGVRLTYATQSAKPVSEQFTGRAETIVFVVPNASRPHRKGNDKRKIERTHWLLSNHIFSENNESNNDNATRSTTYFLGRGWFTPARGCMGQLSVFCANFRPPLVGCSMLTENRTDCLLSHEHRSLKRIKSKRYLSSSLPLSYSTSTRI